MGFTQVSSSQDEFIRDVFYPRFTTDPRKKNKQYILQYARAMYADHRTGSASRFYNYRDQIFENRRFAQGMQDTAQYDERVGDDKDGDTSYMNIDRRIIKLIPKYVDIAIGKQLRFDNHVVCTAIDQLSQRRKEDLYWVKYAEIKQQEFFGGLQAQAGMTIMPPPQENEPETIEELEVFKDLYTKQKYEIAMEQAIELIMQDNEWREVEKALRRHFLVDGIGGTKTYFLHNGKIKIRVVEPTNLVLGYSKRPDFKDLKHIGEIHYITLGELRRRAGSELSDEEYEELAMLYEDKHGNPNVSQQIMDTNMDGSPYDSFKIPVMEFEFKTIDAMVQKKSKTKYGGFRLYDVPYDYEPEGTPENAPEKLVTEFEVIYTGSWVIGTDFIYSCGLAHNMSRNPSNLFEANFSYTIYAPDMVDGVIQSRIERTIPFINAMQLTWLKMQNCKAQAAPEGYSIDFSALLGVPNGAEGGTYKPMELVKIYTQTGRLLYSSLNIPANVHNSRKPIEPMPSSIAQIFEYARDMENCLTWIRAVTGINEASDATLPDKDQPVRTTQMADQATNNSMITLLDAYKNVKCNTAKSLCDKIQLISKKKKVSGYIEALGEANMKLIEASSELSLPEFGIFCEDLPSDEERMFIEQEIQMALKQRRESGGGGIELEDALLVRRHRNPKIAEQVLVIRRKKRIKMDMQIAAQNTQMTTQAQIETAAKTAEMEVMRDNSIGLIKERQINLEKQWDWNIKVLDILGKQVLEKGKTDGKTFHQEQQHTNALDMKKLESLLMVGEQIAEQNTAQSVAAS